MWFEYIRIAIAVLHAKKARFFLTTLSIMIGTASIVLMTSLAESGMKTLFSSVEQIGGARMISVWKKAPEAMESKHISYARGITARDGARLRDIPHVALSTEFAFFGKEQTMQSSSGKSFRGDAIAADNSFFRFFQYRAAQGRIFDAQDAKTHANVCVLGEDLAGQMASAGTHVLGQTIVVSNVRCRVIGVLAKLDLWGIRFGWEWDKILILPIQTIQNLFPEHKVTRQIFFHTEHARHNEFVKRVINARLMAFHHGVDDFSIFDLAKRLAGFMQVFLIMKLIVGFIAAITLLVGGVGIMNMMLVSVAERVREIGIRMAIGARPRDISRQFIMEAALLSGCGGGLGAIMGVLGTLSGSALISYFKPSWISCISYPSVVAALSSAILIGIVFGFVPARRASRLDPVVAIRNG